MDFTFYLKKQTGKRVNNLVKLKFNKDTDFLNDMAEKENHASGNLPIPNSNFSNIKNGKKAITKSQLKLLEKYLSIEAPRLLFGEEDDIFNFLKFSTLLILFNNKDVKEKANPFIPNSALVEDTFFPDSDNKELFQISYSWEEKLVRTSNRLLLVLLATDTENIAENFLNYCYNYFDSDKKFTVAMNNFLTTSEDHELNDLFLEWWRKDTNSNLFINTFNTFMNKNKEDLLNYFRTTLLTTNSNNHLTSSDLLKRVKNDYILDIFTSETFLSFLIDLPKKEQIISLIKAMEVRLSNNNNDISVPVHYYSQEQYISDKQKLEDFYNLHQGKIILGYQKLNLSILQHLDLTDEWSNRLNVVHYEE